jgi:hypothetical protein
MRGLTDKQKSKKREKSLGCNHEFSSIPVILNKYFNYAAYLSALDQERVQHDVPAYLRGENMFLAQCPNCLNSETKKQMLARIKNTNHDVDYYN